MRRTERAIVDRKDLDAILYGAEVLYLAMSDGGVPYVVPMNFGYDGTALYLHSAVAGCKIDILKRQARVSFAVTADYEAIPAETSCGWTARYRSVMGEGTARFLESPEEKTQGLDILMAKFGVKPSVYPAATLARVVVIKVEIRELSGKQAKG